MQVVELLAEWSSLCGEVRLCSHYGSCALQYAVVDPLLSEGLGIVGGQHCAMYYITVARRRIAG